MPAPLTLLPCSYRRRTDEQALDFRLTRRFRRVKPRAATGGTDLGDPRRRFFCIPADNHHFGARPSQAGRHGATQFTGAADDDGDLAGETK